MITAMWEPAHVTVETRALGFVAALTKPLSETAQAAQDARHLAMPIVALGVTIALLYYGRLFFITAISAVIIAFILDPFVALLQRIRCPRPLASVIVCMGALAFLYVIIAGAYTQFTSIYTDLPNYSAHITELVGGVQDRISSLKDGATRIFVPAPKPTEQQQAAQQQSKSKRNAKGQTSPVIPGLPATIPEVRIHTEAPPFADFLTSNFSGFYQIVLMISFIPFLVYFMLSWRDHLNRSFLQFFHGEDRLVAARSLAGIAEMVRAFVVGNFLLGLLLAAISAALFAVIRLPYPMLVGPLSGFLSLVPYIGLPLALAPPLFSALGVNQVSTYILVVVSVSLLHLIALNLLYPKIVGARVHLNPLVVTFSLMLWGFLWDAPGLLLAIPLTAALKAVCDNVKGLRPVGKFLGD